MWLPTSRIRNPDIDNRSLHIGGSGGCTKLYINRGSLTGGNFVSWTNLAISGDVFDFHNRGWGLGANGNYLVEDRDTAKHPILHWRATCNK